MRRLAWVLLLLQTVFDFKVGLTVLAASEIPLFIWMGRFSVTMAVIQSLGLIYALKQPAALARLRQVFVASISLPLVVAGLLLIVPYLTGLLPATLIWKSAGILGIGFLRKDKPENVGFVSPG